MKLITIIGARPQFIKAAAISRVIRNVPGITEKIIHTGQHFDANMSDIFFSEMDIPTPDYHLEINSLTHGAMTGRMLEQIEKVLEKEKPDAVMVYGDTNSTLAGALAAIKMQIPVFHVEAGLRSFNMNMPEEINRILTDRISDVLFCPTKTAVDNLKKEGFEAFDADIVLSGDVMEDAAIYYSSRAEERSAILGEYKLSNTAYVLCTLHRQENTDQPERLANLVTALNTINDTIRVVIPLHPRTSKKLALQGLHLSAQILPPVGYFDMIQLIKGSKLVLTDSGGLQKEAYFFDKYCLTLRDQTEWTELVEGGYNLLTGASVEQIMKALKTVIDRPFVKKESFYGGGHAAEVIRDYILKNYSA